MIDYLKNLKCGAHHESFFIGNSLSVLKQERILKSEFFKGHTTLKIYNEFKWRRSFRKIFLNVKNEVNPHILIVGSSGYGKSTLLKSLILDLNNKKIPIILFDGHNEHSDVLKSINGNVYDLNYRPFNIFALNGLLPEEKINALIHLFNSVYTFGSLQENMIRKVLKYMYRKSGYLNNDIIPDINSFISELLIFRKNSNSIGEKNRIDSIFQRFYALSKIMPNSGAINFEDILNKSCVFQLAGVRSNELRVMYIDSILECLYRDMKHAEINKGISKYIIVDESRALIDRAGKIFSYFFTEARKFGYGLTLVSNSPLLPEGIISNTSTIIAFGLKEPSEITYIANIMGSGIQERSNAIKSIIGSMRKNQAIISSYNLRVTLVRTPDYKQIKTDFNHNDSNLNEKLPLIKKLSNKIIPLEWIIKNMSLNESELQELKTSNAIEIDNNHNSEKEYILNSNSNVSIEHELCIKNISEILKLNGIENVITNGKGPDIIAFFGRSICIEYETGRKNIKDTINMLNNRDYNDIFVIVNNGSYNNYGKIGTDKIHIIKYSDVNNLPNMIKTINMKN